MKPLISILHTLEFEINKDIILLDKIKTTLLESKNTIQKDQTDEKVDKLKADLTKYKSNN